MMAATMCIALPALNWPEPDSVLVLALFMIESSLGVYAY
jgi:hypothetical protein